MKNLVIVESPAKAKTIENILGADYKVVATVGHLIDLPKKNLGVDVDNNFKPVYEVIPGKDKVLSKIKKNLKSTKGNVYLAVDPDREGEAIAWQVEDYFKLKDAKRAVFHEITKTAVTKAIKEAGKTNMELVEAQRARRVLDRLVGYPLSQLIWEKIRYGLSAGRVQSAALRLIMEREKEIENFKPEEFWNIWADVLLADKDQVRVKLVKIDGKPVFKKVKIDRKVKAADIVQDLKKAAWSVEKVDIRQQRRSPPPPFITATLQQGANRAFGYSSKQTMALAQRLYQGVSIKGKGRKSLITYIRTDSVNLANQAVEAMRKTIEAKYGVEYLESQPRRYRNRTKMAQEAHEAIRPTYFDLEPAKVKADLKPKEYRLYKFIYDRALATQMKPAVFDVVDLYVQAEGKTKVYSFNTQAKSLKFEGFMKLYKKSNISIDKDKEQILSLSSQIDKKTKVDLKKIDKEQQFTKPPARYNDASLIKKLKDYGIGRPSTYASIISTLINRNYVVREEKALWPTDTGEVVNDFLLKYFNYIVDYDFTSQMEDDLDKVAVGKMEWQKLVREFYQPFARDIAQKKKSIDKQDVVQIEKSDKKCPECGKPMVVKLGRYGKFYSCSGYPDCKGILPYEKSKTSRNQEILDVKSDKFKRKYLPAPKDGKTEFVLKKGRFGYFWAHPDYPKVKEARPLLLKETCPECKKPLLERKSRRGQTFIGCSGYPKCKYIKKKKKVKKK